VEFPAGTIHSSAMTLRQKEREISFIENVQVALKPEASEEAAPKPAQGGNLFAQSNGPIDIAASRLDINDAGKIALFTGNVRAAQGDGMLTTPELEVGYEGSAGGGASANAQPAGAEKTDAQKTPAKIRRIVAREPVVMTRGEADVVSSNHAEFDIAQETAVLTGNVIMISGTERRATSDRVELDQKADTALLTGAVEVVQGKNELKGSRLSINRKSGHTQLTSLAEDGGNGRVSARLYQGAGKQQSPPKAAKGAEPAGASEAGPFSFKTDPTAPVEVEADQLNVNDGAKVAIFEGNVQATQGEFTINSSELHAFYKGGSGLADVTRSEADRTGQGKQEGTELTRIEAKKNVVVASKRGQTATGDWAEFDAKANRVMVGGDVVVTQGQNMVRGTRLVIDMASGESKIDTAPAKAVAQPSGGGWSAEAPQAGNGTPDSPGRASAVFFPQQLKKGQQNGKGAPEAAGTPQSAPDGWSAQSDPKGAATTGN
jgi:lipopolysaccharide transport protein LptA